MENNIKIKKSKCIVINNDIILKNIKEQYEIYIDNRLNCLLSIYEPITNNFLYIGISMYEKSHIDEILDYIEQIVKRYKKIYIPLKSNTLYPYLIDHGYKCNNQYLYGMLFYKKLG